MASTSLEEHGSRFIAICLSKVFKILAVLASTTTRHEKPSCQLNMKRNFQSVLSKLEE